MKRKLKIFFRAVMFDWPYWRVEYRDGRHTRLLYYRDAQGLADAFDGRLYIDYKVTIR